MKINITTFAVLKEHFSQNFVLDSDIVRTISELKQELIRTRPSAEAIVGSSRFAIDETFVNDSTALYDNASVHIVPPSSGG